MGIIQNGGQEEIVVFKSCVILSGKCQKGIDLLRFRNAVSFFRCEDYVKEKGFSDRKSRTGREIHPHRANFAPRPAVCEKTNMIYLARSIMILLLRSTNLLMASTDNGWLDSIARS